VRNTSALLLPPADPGLVLIQSIGCKADTFYLALEHIQWLHRQGKTEFGILCLPFKLNGRWCEAVGKWDLLPESSGDLESNDERAEAIRLALETEDALEAERMACCARVFDGGGAAVAHSS
jgi:hypothetical protein